MARFFLLLNLLFGSSVFHSDAFCFRFPTTNKKSTSALHATVLRRRDVFLQTTTTLLTLSSSPAFADFAPGGTLVDYTVGVQVGNAQASPSRAFDNSNVLFKQDYYFKFGTAAPFIPEGSTDFPKTMPFVLSQQRYDALKKYGSRIQKGMTRIDNVLKDESMVDPTDSSDVYQLRPMGLLANGFLASENTGTTNELLLARYYINEVYLDLQDIQRSTTSDKKRAAHEAAKRALNSYLGMLNRVITPKVGDKFELLSV